MFKIEKMPNIRQITPTIILPIQIKFDSNESHMVIKKNLTELIDEVNYT